MNSLKRYLRPIAGHLAIVLTLTSLVTARAIERAPAGGTRLITLGTAGGPPPRNDRAQSSNLVVVNDTLYLIDAGDGVTRRIGQAGYDYWQARHVFLTHLHSDHTSGLAPLLGAIWDLYPRTVVDIYGSGVEALVQGTMRFLTPNAEIRSVARILNRPPMAEAFRSHEVQPGLVFQDANVKVTAVENSHFRFQPGSAPYGKYRSYSYRFDTADRSIVFTGDTGPSEAVVDLAKQADILVAEINAPDDVIELLKRAHEWETRTLAEQAMFRVHLEEEHLIPAEVGKMAAKAGVKMVVLSHITADPDGSSRRCIDGIRKYYSGPVAMAKDLMQF